MLCLLIGIFISFISLSIARGYYGCDGLAPFSFILFIRVDPPHPRDPCSIFLENVAKRHTKGYNWYVKIYSWNNEKNALLKAERQISFEEIVLYIEMGFLLDVLEHPNQEKYKGQKVFVVRVDDYVYLVPFIETEKEVFLKTIIPSRKATRKYLKGSKK
jgi:hypothetical protein